MLERELEAEICHRFVKLSCEKMVISRSSRSGARLHRNLLILHLLKKARNNTNMWVHLYLVAHKKVLKEAEKWKAAFYSVPKWDIKITAFSSKRDKIIGAYGESTVNPSPIRLLDQNTQLKL